MNLETPSVHYFPSFRRSMEEWGTDHQDGAGIRDAETLSSRTGFEEWVEQLKSEESTPAAPGLVTCTYLWMVEGAEYLGSIALRHELNEYLATFGGHIGYSVRPSARRRGVASQALREMVQVAADRGIERLLLTCAAGNRASQKTIEAAGGVFEREIRDEEETLYRYWITIANEGSPQR